MFRGRKEGRKKEEDADPPPDPLPLLLHVRMAGGRQWRRLTCCWLVLLAILLREGERVCQAFI